MTILTVLGSFTYPFLEAVQVAHLFEFYPRAVHERHAGKSTVGLTD